MHPPGLAGAFVYGGTWARLARRTSAMRTAEPFLGWLSLPYARILWSVTALAALAWTTSLLVRESRSKSRLESLVVALLLLAMNQTGVAVGHGQLILHLLPVLLVGVLIVQRGSGTWHEDVRAAACLLLALVKITITIPFLWLAFFTPGSNNTGRAWRVRPILLVALGYVGLTAFATSFQPDMPWRQLKNWLAEAQVVSQSGGYADVHSWLSALGLKSLMLPASAVLLLALGVWTYRYRRVDLWIRLGVAGLVARIWMYHRQYDDVIVVFALVALRQRVVAGRDAALSAWLLATAMFLMLLPARLQNMPAPWWMVYNGGHAMVFFALLAWLCWEAHQQQRGLPVVR